MDSYTAGIFLFPWPLYYEVLRTRFVRRAGWVESFSQIARSAKLRVIDDVSYRERALEETLDISQRERGISLVDSVIRGVLCDPNISIIEMVTFNVKDFQDVCGRRGVQIRSR